MKFTLVFFVVTFFAVVLKGCSNPPTILPYGYREPIPHAMEFQVLGTGTAYVAYVYLKGQPLAYAVTASLPVTYGPVTVMDGMYGMHVNNNTGSPGPVTMRVLNNGVEVKNESITVNGWSSFDGGV